MKIKDIVLYTLCALAITTSTVSVVRSHVIQGEQGIQGEVGLKGDKGDKGEDGLNGLDGKDGKDGRDGVDGKDGAKGDKGDAGLTGAQGEKGDKGDKGDAFTYDDFTDEQLESLKEGLGNGYITVPCAKKYVNNSDNTYGFIGYNVYTWSYTANHYKYFCTNSINLDDYIYRYDSDSGVTYYSFIMKIDSIHTGYDAANNYYVAFWGTIL